MKGLDWLQGGNDRKLAATRYAGRESATDRAAAKRQAKARARQQAGVREAARAGEAWEQKERRRTR
ncbi:hypothetical protein J7E96_28370 [Streptomyces sp. ISL-96]|uniref:hypothetical protein n=1 Tax=Streptomyces sp. ISL-96 TaxID=2819191 RepID=UPI001BE69177|nr:hypothetical protein [Streptomyces sp. ISL-96]MBT2492356.1 hypothetical protein [Streptomyces sp. ISL-96]